MIHTALIQQTYGRPLVAADNLKRWTNSADRPNEVEFLVGMDDVDETIPQYYQSFNIPETEKLGRFEINIGPSRTGVQAMNRVAKTMSKSTELIIVVADDIHPIPSWDTILFDVLKGVDNFKDPKYIIVCDGLNNKPGSEFNGIDMCPYVFINRAFYNKLGYVMWNEYIASCSDMDLFSIARMLNVMIDARHLYFEHEHWVTHTNKEFDETYKRRNSLEQYNIGYKIFLERKARNFDLEV